MSETKYDKNAAMLNLFKNQKHNAQPAKSAASARINNKSTHADATLFNQTATEKSPHNQSISAKDLGEADGGEDSGGSGGLTHRKLCQTEENKQFNEKVAAKKALVNQMDTHNTVFQGNKHARQQEAWNKQKQRPRTKTASVKFAITKPAQSVKSNMRKFMDSVTRFGRKPGKVLNPEITDLAGDDVAPQPTLSKERQH